FWRIMELNNWAYLKDMDMKRISFEELPRSLQHLEDNPLRSLASVILKDNPVGDIKKVGIPFEEFYYAEFLAANGIDIPQNSAKSMKEAMEDSLKLLRSKKGMAFREQIP